MAVLLSSMRMRFSKAATRLGVSAGGGGATVLASSGGAAGIFAASRLASRSSSSTTSLRNSPSAVKGRRSITRNASSGLRSDTVLSSTILYHLEFSMGWQDESLRRPAVGLEAITGAWFEGGRM